LEKLFLKGRERQREGRRKDEGKEKTEKKVGRIEKGKRKKELK
jgi:hypothetical protein